MLVAAAILGTAVQTSRSLVQPEIFTGCGILWRCLIFAYSQRHPPVYAQMVVVYHQYLLNIFIKVTNTVGELE